MHDLTECGIVEVFCTQGIAGLNKLLRRGPGANPDCSGLAAIPAIGWTCEPEKKGE
jgi:hypothetical protein